MTKVNDDLPSNSRSKRAKPTAGKNVPIRATKADATEDRIEVEIKSVSATPRVRKESFISKFTNTFFGDTPDGVARYIMWEVLIPAAKETLQDMITKGTGLLLYGEDAHTRRSSSRRGPTISYGRYFDDGRNERARPRRDTVRGSRGSVLENIVFDDEHDANTVFEILISHLETYGHVSVSDYYDAANVGHLGDYTDNNWGWTNMSRARVIRSRDGYELILPEPRALD